jgi:hypothetical protein
VPRCLAPLLLLAALAGCGGGEEPAEPSSSGPARAEFAAAVDERCDRTRGATREGPRFPFRDFDPSNPDRRLRAVGRFYEKLDSEGTVTALVEDLRAIEPPDSVAPAYEEMLSSLEGLVAAMREQTKAAAAGSRERTIEATADVELAFDELGETASDAGAFLCALSLERKPKALR